MKLPLSSRWLAALALALRVAPAQPDHRTFSVRGHPGYPRPEATLGAFVAGKPGAPRVNTFCAVGYHDASGAAGDDVAWVHWRQGHALVLWEPSADPEHPVTLGTSRRVLDLRRDVVGSDAEVGASTYLVTRAWVDGVLRDCARRGDRFVVRQQAPR